ncbi:MAG: undecaprenyldiphospho-muramoylpentapeptide beta-N-acetylglucosaminyltransferase [Flavobacteriales bacterium]|nr:undecaprenyldiphospho-muramoylpentapeptide beta-N-acetylglucosaminyltransferase [Flavobacteriales bacterium]
MISGGGTGGHIFPAIAIADALKKEDQSTQILFVGAQGRMEMERVPKAGYEIVGLNISGIQRRLTWKNLLVPFKLISSLLKARSLIKSFRPDAAIGVGGYASGPLLRVASWMGIPTLLQEQNSYPGITNKLLAKRADSICVAYDGMGRFFDENKLVLTGNPTRENVTRIEGKKEEALKEFGLEQGLPVLLVIGGSLGARSINNAIKENLNALVDRRVQVIWQTGRFYFEEMKSVINSDHSVYIHPLQFIDRMDLAYAAADIIISRAGAISISELCIVGKPTILVPSPNVSEDHQTKNAMALVNRKAAILIKDSEISSKLVNEMDSLIDNKELQKELSKNILPLGIKDAPKKIVEEIYRISKP